MRSIEKPMLAAKFDPDKARFPYLVSPKIDGIRFIVRDGIALTRSLKPIRNNYAQKLLAALPDGVDGEVTCGETFQDTTSYIMSIKPPPKEITAHLFDFLPPRTVFEPILPFKERLKQLANISLPDLDDMLAYVLSHTWIEDLDALQFFHDSCLSDGYEGTMLRDPKGTYKFGRSTVNENILLKLKDFTETEGVIVGFAEKLTNTNPATVNALGYQERSSHQENRLPTDMLGAFVLQIDNEGTTVRCGSGFTAAQRIEMWRNRDLYLGRTVKFKYLAHGTKNLPRHPIFLGFRDTEDM